MMRTLLLAGLGLVCAIAGSSVATVDHENVWADGVTYIMTSNEHAAGSSQDQAQRDLYIIAPVDAADPQSLGHPGLGAHDHVLAAPAHSGGEFSANWHVFLVVPGPSAGNAVHTRPVAGAPDLVYEVDLGAGFVPLTSTDVLEDAEDAGLVGEIDTGIHFVCPIHKA